ncbi:helix-turn-helix domain-containing protein [Candidatus Accumulibacter sp. ACC003]|uniref:helix-turn-helix domain-containing protein n=1 Tax=Candidatus Accumulibacter sp. ACC003 TaxID=2823334 RepID=UPI0025BD083E|nr:helix-turn-helix domain-containing protein [Candidatus Accumulibacter sp. ACC003]
MSETPNDGPAAGRLSYEQQRVLDVEAGALAARLKALIGNESIASFARKCAMAESVLRTYLRDGRMPPLDKAFAIAAAAGVSVDWLATGQGARTAAQVRASYTASAPGAATGEPPAVDGAVLEGILKAVLSAQGAHASPAQLAALVVDLYQRALHRGE